jgi:hypothetical protein
MPINNWDSNLRVETNVNNVIRDNEEWLAEKNQLEHQQNPTEPWQQGFVDPQVVQQKIKELYEEFKPVEADPALLEANNQDLKRLNIRNNQ